MGARISLLKSEFCDVLHGGLTAKRLAIFLQCIRSLMAHSVIRGMSAIWSLSDQSGHWLAMVLNASVANDPIATEFCDAVN